MTAAVLAACAACQAAVAGAQGDGAKPFSGIVNPVGWELPTYKAVVRSGAYEQPDIPSGVRFTEFESGWSGTLPFYYVQDGRLVLQQASVQIERLSRLDINGRVFAYVALAKGTQAGMAGRVWWVDRDGDLSFEEFDWEPKVPPVPDWVLSVATKR